MPEDTSGPAERAINKRYDQLVGEKFETFATSDGGVTASVNFENDLRKLNERRAQALKIAERAEPKPARVPKEKEPVGAPK